MLRLGRSSSIKDSKPLLSTMNEKTCKICKEIITEKEFEKLKRNIDNDMSVKSKYWGCYIESRVNSYGVGF